MRDWKASQRHKLLFFFAAAAVMRIKVKKKPTPEVIESLQRQHALQEWDAGID